MRSCPVCSTPFSWSILVTSDATAALHPQYPVFSMLPCWKFSGERCVAGLVSQGTVAMELQINQDKCFQGAGEPTVFAGRDGMI
eukprot:1152217-Pelagomonas_calceolata.AAC.3